jgi:hypothetical protein
MHLPHLLGAGVGLALLGFTFAGSADTASPPTAPPAPPEANGHYVLVVEGDRDRLAIQHATHKTDPWAGVPKGLASAYVLTIRDAAGVVLAEIPLDVSQFDLDAERQGKPLRVTGCVVRDPHVAMLVNAPCFDAAATYTFTRGATALGVVEGEAVRRLAGGGR